MAFLFCVSRDGTSSDTNYRLYVNENTINYDNEFAWTQNGITKTYKKAVGVYFYYAPYNTYYMGVVACNSNLNQCWKLEEYTPNVGTREYVSEYGNYGYSYGFGSDKPVNFGDVIPFFNNYDDASNWSRDLPYDSSNWVGGKSLISYTWQSVPSISGKNGISLLSIIKSSAINSGDAVSGANADAFDRLEESTKISTLIQGISEETPIIYSDDVNYMSITPTANNTCTLKFYLHGNVIYTLTDVSINAYLSFLIDEANGIMKPSIIYEDS